MGITTGQYERIIRFLDAAMDPAEMDAFEKELTANPEMREQLDFEQSVRENFGLRDRPWVPAVPSPARNMESPENSGKLRKLWRALAIGAAIVGACLVIFLFWQKKATHTNLAGSTPNANITAGADALQKAPTMPSSTSDSSDLALLFTRNFQKDVLPDTYPVYLAEALTDYESGNYATLEKLDFKSLPQARGIDERDGRENILKWGHYFKGLAFLQTGSLRDASANLLWVLKSQPGKALRAKTQWYLALTFLKGNDAEKAAELCRRIVEDKENPVLVEKAQKILESLQK